ncbi:MAG: IPExxxVDY family protein [Bacteroidales bacterium]|nr:IPExxxVDY family protein [Bacteroidales bacterium]
MTKKIILNIDLCQEYKIIAISCHLKYYKLTYYINNLFGFNLTKLQNLVFNDNANFNIFYFNDAENFRTYYLISNKGEKGFLFRKLKNIDYFFFIKSQITNKQKQTLINNIKKIPSVLTAFEIDMGNIKGINDILIDIENQIYTSFKK